MSDQQSETRFTPHLDEMLTLERAAAWLGLKPDDLREKSSGLKPKIPAFRAGHKTVRYHPRTIIAKLARDAGVPTDVIAASFGIDVDRVQP